jgi:hypothetical protein
MSTRRSLCAAYCASSLLAVITLAALSTLPQLIAYYLLLVLLACLATVSNDGPVLTAASTSTRRLLQLAISPYMLTIIASLIFAALSALSEVCTCFFLSQLSYHRIPACLVIGKAKVFRLRAGCRS